MNRSDTVPRVLALLTQQERTISEIAEEMGEPRSTVQGAINRLKAKGKLDRRVDDLGYVRWKARA